MTGLKGWKWEEIISIENQRHSFKFDEGGMLAIYSDGMNMDLGRLYVPASENTCFSMRGHLGQCLQFVAVCLSTYN